MRERLKIQLVNSLEIKVERIKLGPAFTRLHIGNNQGLIAQSKGKLCY